VFYRILTVIGGAIFVAILFALVWLFCRLFLQRQGVTEELQERATNLATWTFLGISVGLVFAIVGAFVLGPWAFYRALRGYGLAVDPGKAIGWGFLIVVVSLGITAVGFFGFLGAGGRLLRRITYQFLAKPHQCGFLLIGFVPVQMNIHRWKWRRRWHNGKVMITGQ